MSETPFNASVARLKTRDENVYKQKNKLKDLIYIQENKPCNEQTIKGLFRSIVEPVLEKNVESLVLCRLEDKSKNELSGILKRLQYSSAKVYDFSDTPLNKKFENILKEKIWDKTEFIYVLAERFGAVLVFDYEESDIEGFAHFYIMHNSKRLSEAFEVINANSSVNLSEYEEKTRPDRRDNDLLNLSIRKVVENLNETNQEFMISQMEQEKVADADDLASRLEFLITKSNQTVHEMRNLLSICSLYSNIIEKQNNQVKFETPEAEKSIMNARDCIRKSMQMCGNLLLDFKSLNSIDLKECDLEKLIKTALSLAQIYAAGKNISFKSNINSDIKVLADENKFLSVLINLIKNAVESIDSENGQKGEVSLSTEVEDENIKVIISNNGSPISKEVQQRLFEEGFTTKNAGTGLGLVICKKTLEEQFAQLKLRKSDETSTEFEITLLKA